ncbi:serine/threonine protein kinase [Aphanomyces invadans]|uniref:Serine/threonine protein kinase n=1 Tax=Aphanomyces invadans TaxID=157072 RepID=A0A024ULY8_9STRA|nr:serine/threonine protein kinase [Aphanomyces invadans]ETW07314.1 serine/threonine protein kinase [Aphanomyces invadans]|eukprot:XP_008863407.1 serine/threonine protein kinase [Aphanomyces invadans]
MYTVVAHIATAANGGIWLCRNAKGRQSAVKRCEVGQSFTSSAGTTGDDDIELSRTIDMERTINLTLQKHRHRHILEMEDYFEVDGFHHLVFEYCPNGDLLSCMKALPAGRFPQAQAIHYMRQIVSAVHHMHTHGIAHRDLSLENVLLDNDRACKVCDFGLAVAVPSVHDDAVGKLNYMAPEVYAEMEYDPRAADVWSLGMMLFIMITGVPLVHVPDEAADKRFGMLTQFGVLALVNRWKLEGLFSEPVLELIERMLELDPARRIQVVGVKKALGKLKRAIHPTEFRTTSNARLAAFLAPLRRWLL